MQFPGGGGAQINLHHLKATDNRFLVTVFKMWIAFKEMSWYITLPVILNMLTDVWPQSQYLNKMY